MLRAAIIRLFRGRHYWRNVSFDEIAELYTSRLITIFAINTVNLFAAIYLYKLGYSFVFIALFYALFFAVRALSAPLAAKYVAYYGPKHGVLVSNLLRIPSLIAFAWLPVSGDYSLLSIALFGLFQQLSVGLYDISYLVDFSKVRHSEHSGKEIGVMQQMEKVARILSPLVGGLVASLWSPEATIVIASALFLVAAMPLFKTVEPTQLRGRIKMSGFPWRLAWRSFLSESAVGFDSIISGMVWTLFIAVTVFATFGNGVYASLGGLASLGTFASIVAVWVFGRIIDKHHGDVLLVLGTVTNTVMHLVRPFTSSVTGVMGVNIANESATSAYAMPFTRVMFDIADSSGFRIAYMMMIEIMVCSGTVLACLLFAACVSLWGNVMGCTVLFFIASIYELLILLSARAAR